MFLSIPPSLLYSCLRQGVGESQKGAFARQAGRRRRESTSGAAFVALVGQSPESSDHEEFGNSNLWFPNSCGPRGSQWVQAQPAGRQWPPSRPTQAQAAKRKTETSSAARYCARCSNGCGRQRDQGSVRRLSYARIAWPPRQQVEPGTARPLTLSNAVPWVRSERDTFRSNQLLVVGRRRGASN